MEAIASYVGLLEPDAQHAEEMTDVKNKRESYRQPSPRGRVTGWLL